MFPFSASVAIPVKPDISSPARIKNALEAAEKELGKFTHISRIWRDNSSVSFSSDLSLLKPWKSPLSCPSAIIDMGKIVCEITEERALIKCNLSMKKCFTLWLMLYTFLSVTGYALTTFSPIRFFILLTPWIVLLIGYTRTYLRTIWWTRDIAKQMKQVLVKESDSTFDQDSI